MDKVLCPWCNSEMELETDGLFDVGSCGEDDFYHYECPCCAAQAPISYSAETALATALARPLQKPLTLEEAQKNPAVIYYEHRTHPEANGYGVFDKFRERYQMENGSILPMLSKHVRNVSIYYGAFLKDWRCWATKPSDEERKAAKWDD